MDHVRVDRFGEMYLNKKTNQVKESSKKQKLKSEKTKDTTKAETKIYKRGVRPLARNRPSIAILAVNLDIAKEIRCGQY